MTRTEELMKLAEAAKSKSMISVIPFRVAANPETIKQLVELVRLQHEAVRQYATMMPLWKAGVEALEAFNKFEQGGK